MGFCLFWRIRLIGTARAKTRAVALDLTSRTWELKELMSLVSTEVALKHPLGGDWGAPSKGFPPGAPAATCLHHGSPGCHEGAEWQRCRMEAGRCYQKCICQGDWGEGESLGPSRCFFFPSGTECIGVLDIHLCRDCTCCSWVVPLWIEHWAGPVRCTRWGLHWFMPSE